MVEDRYLVYARKWRPQTFDDVIGQDHITRTLQNAISTGRIAHAFLFIGSRGIGKTTTARILAKALNCLAVDAPTCQPCNTCDNCRSISEGNNIDVIEIDGASNNSVDDVREIRENVRLVPSRARYKVYIIDEVHQLSPGAFNALLKTIEEPPAHAIFILATTEAHKVPATIVSRCQRFDFRRVATDRICVLLRRILDKEGIRATDEALQAVARAAEGGIRDAESILDQLVSYCDKEITFKDVFDVLGLVDWQILHDLSDAIFEKDVAKQLRIVEDVVSAGKDLSQFVQDILRYYRNLLVCKTGGAKTLLALPEDEIAKMKERARRHTLTGLIRLVEQFAELTKGFESQLAQRIALETLLIRISKRAVEMSVDTVIEKIMQLSEGGARLPSAKTVESAPRGESTTPRAGASEAAPVPQTYAADPPRSQRAESARERSDEAPRPSSPPPLARASAAEVREAMKDPHVSKVVDVFKGRVVEIKRDGKPAH
jgi:DNA polymerase-3 subunit gamma/tau